MVLSERILLVVFLSYQVIISYQWNPPSFISKWITIRSPVSSNIEILHCLNELPVKVDVQIKVVNNGVGYIFTGTGTTQRDDDDSINPLGGIVYVYNDQKVVLYPPTVNGIGLAYTGSETDFNGPASARGLYHAANVRVRAWKASAFPAPLFNIKIPVSDDSAGCFKQETYNSAIKPDLVVAQVYLPNGMISEGQGNIFLNDTGINTKWMLTGVVFGYDDRQVKLWVPIHEEATKHCSGVVFGFGDGFGISDQSCYSESSGIVFLKGYKLDKAFQKTFPHGTSFSSPNTITFERSYSLDTALVMVQVREKLNTANNPGMTFIGAGSSMAGSVRYSGVVYAYNESSAFLYTPSKNNPNGYMIYLGDRWGNRQHPSSEQLADVIVTVFSGITSTSNVTYAECTPTSTADKVTTPMETSTSDAPTAIRGESTFTSTTASTGDGESLISTPEMSTERGDGLTTQTETSTKETNSVTSTANGKSMSTSNTASTGDGKSLITTQPVMSTDSTKITSDSTGNNISTTKPLGSRAIVLCPYDAANLCDCEVVQNLDNVQQESSVDKLYKIDIKKTSAYIRQHSSAYDGRLSAKVMGLTGSAVLIIIVLLVVCLDITRIRTVDKLT